MKKQIIGLATLTALAIFTSCKSDDNEIDNGNGEQPKPGVSVKKTLIHTTPEEIGDNCSTGGIKILIGLDTNGNAILDTDEIQSTQYVCGKDGTNGTDGKDGINGTDGENGTNGSDGKDGLSTLIKTSNLAENSDNCTSGGIKIESGIDTNSDGNLSETEIDNTQYVCNGEIINGHNSLINITEETAGDNCAHGGKKIETGLDSNDNGTLETEEINATEYICEASAAGNSFNILIEDKIFYGLDTLSSGSFPSSNFRNGFELRNLGVDCTEFEGQPTATKNIDDNYYKNAQKYRIKGIDDNENNLIEPNETYNSSSFLSCINQVNIKNVNLPISTLFPYGGVKSSFGPDANENGILDNDEELQTEILITVPNTDPNFSEYDKIEIIVSDQDLRERSEYGTIVIRNENGIIDENETRITLFKGETEVTSGIDLNNNYQLEDNEKFVIDIPATNESK